MAGLRRDQALYDRVGKMWTEEGLSAAQIGERIGKSRSAVLGMVHRMGSQRRTVGGEKAPQPPAPPRKTAAALAVTASPRHAVNPLGAHGLPAKATPPVKPDALTATARPWLEREPGQCKWPFVVLHETFSCCAPADGPYCPDHAAIAFNGIPKPRKRATAKYDGAW